MASFESEPGLGEAAALPAATAASAPTVTGADPATVQQLHEAINVLNEAQMAAMMETLKGRMDKAPLAAPSARPVELPPGVSEEPVAITSSEVKADGSQAVVETPGMPSEPETTQSLAQRTAIPGTPPEERSGASSKVADVAQPQHMDPTEMQQKIRRLEALDIEIQNRERERVALQHLIEGKVYDDPAPAFTKPSHDEKNKSSVIAKPRHDEYSLQSPPKEPRETVPTSSTAIGSELKDRLKELEEDPWKRWHKQDETPM